MRLVEWSSEDGYKHLSLVKDDDTDDMAPYGISRDPPNIDQLDWQAIKRDLHNALVERRLTDWRDVQKNQDSLAGAVMSVLHRQLKILYRSKMTEVKNG